MTAQAPPDGADSREPPPFPLLVAELSALRERGLGTMRHHAYPALYAACGYCDLLVDGQQEPAAIEELLRKAVAQLGGGEAGDAAEYTFGLAQGTKLWSSGRRRTKAAELMELSEDRFRKQQERLLIEQVAEGILTLCRDQTMRRTRLDLERRHPADSRLAVKWVERFEAYYRIWTPVGKLAADLEAAIDTRRGPDSDTVPWDQDSDETYDREDQALGYGRYALHAYAWFQLELHDFMTRHGGLWLFSDHEVEAEIAGAVYRIGWHNPLNQDDDSWLRRTLADSRHRESQHFHAVLHSTRIGQITVGEWQDYVRSCRCPDEQIAEDCQVHAAVRACRDFCSLVDVEWLKIADWYRVGADAVQPVSGGRLFDALVDHRQRLKSTE